MSTCKEKNSLFSLINQDDIKETNIYIAILEKSTLHVEKPIAKEED